MNKSGDLNSFRKAEKEGKDGGNKAGQKRNRMTENKEED